MTLLQEQNALKKTPLYDRHVALNGKMVPFAGWIMPVYYSGIISEHQEVRRHCGFFDVSHLGEFHVSGPGAFDFLQRRLSNDMAKLSDGKILYHLLLDENGRTLDDLLVYQEKTDDYFLIVNAANIEKDFQALERYKPDSVTMKDHSDDTGCVAIQGPGAEALIRKIFGFDLSKLGYYAFTGQSWQGQTLWISRSGYTGEDGFEFFAKPETTQAVWDRLVSDGRAAGAVPAGLGARNTLRLEAGNALYGNDLDETTTPLEAGMGWAVAMGKGSFVGRDALIKQKDRGVGRSLVGFRMLDKSIAREHYAIFRDRIKIGHVTSGSYGPTVGENIGLGYVDKGSETPGTRLEVEVHGRRAAAEVVKTPFVQLKHKKALQKN